MKRSGVTLVEAVIGLAVAAVVLGFAIGLLCSAVRSMKLGDDRLDQREHGHLALARLRALLADARGIEIESDGATVAVSTPRGRATLRFEPARGALALEQDGQPRCELAAKLTGFRVRMVAPGLYKISIDTRARHAPRMVDEVYCPALTSRPTDQPFQSALGVRRPYRFTVR